MKIRGLRYCPRCEYTKPLEQFHIKTYRGTGNKGRRHICKECHLANCKMKRRADPEGYRRRGREVARRRREKALNYKANYRYNISLEGIECLREEQGGVCAICKGVPIKWHIDHNHQTKKVRGLLCERCNHGLGHFRDNPTFMRAGAAYIERDLREQMRIVD